MSPLDSKPEDGQVQKQKANIYLMMLILSFLALVIACVFCVLDMNTYEWKLKPPKASLVPSATTSTVTLAQAPLAAKMVA